MFADKLRSISNKTMMRRVKDIYDISTMSGISGYTITSVLEIYQYEKRELGDFRTFVERVPEIRHAYDRLRGIPNKPEFDVVYAKVSEICMPFITGDYKMCGRGVDAVWDSRSRMWRTI